MVELRPRPVEVDVHPDSGRRACPLQRHRDHLLAACRETAEEGQVARLHPRAIARRPLELDSRQRRARREAAPPEPQLQLAARVSQPPHGSRSSCGKRARDRAPEVEPGLDADDLLLQHAREGGPLGRGGGHLLEVGQVLSAEAARALRGVASREEPQGTIERRLRSGGVSPSHLGRAPRQPDVRNLAVDRDRRVGSLDRSVVVACIEPQEGEDRVGPEVPGAAELERPPRVGDRRAERGPVTGHGAGRPVVGVRLEDPRDRPLPVWGHEVPVGLDRLAERRDRAPLPALPALDDAPRGRRDRGVGRLGDGQAVDMPGPDERRDRKRDAEDVEEGPAGPAQHDGEADQEEGHGEHRDRRRELGAAIVPGHAGLGQGRLLQLQPLGVEGQRAHLLRAAGSRQVRSGAGDAPQLLDGQGRGGRAGARGLTYDGRLLAAEGVGLRRDVTLEVLGCGRQDPRPERRCRGAGGLASRVRLVVARIGLEDPERRPRDDDRRQGDRDQPSGDPLPPAALVVAATGGVVGPAHAWKSIVKPPIAPTSSTTTPTPMNV